MHLLPLLWTVAIIAGIVYVFIRQNRERARNAPLRNEIEARVCFSTTLDYARLLGTGGFWIAIKGPKRLVVATGQNGARLVHLGVTRKGSLPAIWQALTGAGAAPR